MQARLTIVAAVETLLGSDEPGEVDGDLVPAAMVRELATALGLLPQPGEAPVTARAGLGRGVDGTAAADGADTSPAGDVAGADVERGVDGAATREAADTTSTGGVAGWVADGAAVQDRDGATPVDDLAGLLGVRRVSGTALAGRPHVALVDGLSGQLLALSDAADLRNGRGLGPGPPPAAPGYRPGDRLDRFVRHRDRRCRFPGCRARPTRSDLDHTVPWPAGPTSAANLACLCRHHHRLRHQAPGRRLRAVADGGLEWTMPGGRTATTHPPRFGADDDSPPGRTVRNAAAVSTATPPPSDVGLYGPRPF